MASLSDGWRHPRGVSPAYINPSNPSSRFLAPFHIKTSSIQDALKLLVIGGTVETARRVSSSAWNGLIDSFYLTANFSREDYPYDWLMHWLSKQPEWIRSREFEIATCPVGRGQSNQSVAGDLGYGNIDEESVRPMEDGHNNRKVTFKPRPGTTHTVFYRGHWLKITPIRSNQDFGNYSALEISIVAHNNDVLKRLVLEAQREYEKDAEYGVHIFTADAQNGCWGWNGKRPRRPLSSIVLQPAIKEMLLADCRDFLRSEDWYAERGLPFRRGYLLHGAPRSGKTSLVYSIAGELGLDICVLIMSSPGMNDHILMKLMKTVPPRSILLLEDLDAAFTCGITSTADSTANTHGGSVLSLSGFLTSLDWIDPAKGRLVFVTTNHVERLDPALGIPGRMDVSVNFTHASKWQAEELFKLFFFPSRPPAASPPNESPSLGAPRENLTRARRAASAHAVPVLEEAEIVQLTRRFANAIPEGEMSFASIQGFLLKNRRRPRECVDEVTEWCSTINCMVVMTGEL